MYFTNQFSERNDTYMPRTKTAAQQPQKTASAKEIRRGPKTAQSEQDIFGLDIGTRNVVGIIGHMDDGVFTVDESVSIPHKRRAMIDGQIEDIAEVARVVKLVKGKLEEKTGVSQSQQRDVRLLQNVHLLKMISKARTRSQRRCSNP